MKTQNARFTVLGIRKQKPALPTYRERKYSSRRYSKLKRMATTAQTTLRYIAKRGNLARFATKVTFVET